VVKRDNRCVMCGQRPDDNFAADLVVRSHDALPFSVWLSKVHKSLNMSVHYLLPLTLFSLIRSNDSPINAIALSMVFTVILNLIAVGSEVAHTILISLNVSGLLTSYILCISCECCYSIQVKPAALHC
jgi:hypothetical protein